MFTSKPNLKVQNINIKPFLKPSCTHDTPCFETAYLGKNIKTFFGQKIAQNVDSSLGFFIFSRNDSDLPEVDKLAKNHPIWSPCLHEHSDLVENELPINI